MWRKTEYSWMTSSSTKQTQTLSLVNMLQMILLTMTIQHLIGQSRIIIVHLKKLVLKLLSMDGVLTIWATLQLRIFNSIAIFSLASISTILFLLLLSKFQILVNLNRNFYEIPSSTDSSKVAVSFCKLMAEADLTSLGCNPAAKTMAVYIDNAKTCHVLSGSDMTKN